MAKHYLTPNDYLKDLETMLDGHEFEIILGANRGHLNAGFLSEWQLAGPKAIAKYLVDYFPGPMVAAKALLEGKTVIKHTLWIRLKKHS